VAGLSDHRRASPRLVALVTSPVLRFVLVFGCLGLPWNSRLSADEKDPVDFTIRVQWLLPKAQGLAGQLHLSDGRLHVHRNLSLDPASTGGLRVSDDLRTLSIGSRSAIERGGCELQVKGPSTAKLKLELRGEADQTPVTVECELLQLVDQTISQSLWDQGQLYISRAPVDALHVSMRSDSQIFSTGQVVNPRVRVVRLKDFDNDSLAVRVQLQQARGGKVIETRRFDVKLDAHGSADEFDVGIWNLPAEEGVLEYQVSLHKPSTLPWRWNAPLVQRRLQFVVMQTGVSAAPIPVAEQWQELARIPVEASENTGWTAGLPEAPQRWFRGGQANLRGGDLVSAVVDQRAVASLRLADWRAMELPSLEPGRKHRVRVVYRAGSELTKLGVSIVEPDAAGRVGPLGVDSGCTANSVHPLFEPAWAEQVIEFWPRTSAPWVLLFGLDAKHPAQVAELIVESNTVPSRSGIRPHAASSPRTAAIYLDKPLLAQCLGASRVLEEDATSALDDWVTFWEAGRRLVEHVQDRGCNAAVLTVASEGGAIYPSERLQATPRFDMGPFQKWGQDPAAKDVVELLMRQFDQAGLRLIPALELTTPLIELESLKDRDAATFAGIELVDGQGRLAPAQPGSGGLRPLYNPLHPQVQAAVERVILEVVQRYQQHPSFAGVALQLGPTTYVQLPGDRWARDAQTLQRFQSSLPGSIPRGIEIQQWVDGPGLEYWRRWRCQELADWYGRLSRRLNRDQPLWLMTADVVEGESHRGNTEAPPTAAAQGLDWNLLQGVPNLVVVQTLRHRPLAPLQRQLDDEAHGEWSLAQPRTGFRRGTMLYMPPVPTRVPSFEAVSPWGPDRTQARFYSVAGPSETSDGARLQLIRSLQASDQAGLLVGSWLPLPTPGALLDWMDQWIQLPASEFRDLPPAVALDAQGEPTAPPSLIVRAMVDQATTWVYVANPQSVEQEVLIPWQVPEGAAINALGGSIPAQLDRTAYRTVLPAGEFQAIRIDHGQVPIGPWQARFTLSPESLERWYQRMQQVRDWLPTESRIDAKLQPKNADFTQQAGSNQIPGWLHSQHTVAQVTAVFDPPDSRRDCLLLQSSKEHKATTWLISDPLPTPAAGRLQLAVYARTDESSGSARLRVALEARHQGLPFRRSLTIEAQDGDRLPRVWEASPIRLQVTDLPTDGLEELRIAIDWIGEGQIWIDRVELQSDFLTDRERTELQRRTFVAIEDLRRGDPRAAARLLERVLISQQFGGGSPAQTDVVDSKAIVEKETESEANPTETQGDVESRAAAPWREWLIPGRWR